MFGLFGGFFDHNGHGTITAAERVGSQGGGRNGGGGPAVPESSEPDHRCGWMASIRRGQRG
jgi:hypothetical protein